MANMVKRDNPKKSNEAAAKALELAKQNPAVSDFRKESETWQFLASRRSSIDEIEDFVGAIQRDYSNSFVNGDDVDRYLAPIDTFVRLKLIDIKLRMLQKQLERR